MRNAPFFVIEKRQVEVQHSEIVASMEEIVGRNNGVAQAETGQNHQIFIIESGGQRGREKRHSKQSVDEKLQSKCIISL